MQTEMTLNRRGTLVENIVKSALCLWARPLNLLSAYYSDVLKRPISSGQTWSLLNAQAAFVVTVFAGCALPLRVVCVAWLLGAVWRCKKVLA